MCMAAASAPASAAVLSFALLAAAAGPAPLPSPESELAFHAKAYGKPFRTAAGRPLEVAFAVAPGERAAGAFESRGKLCGDTLYLWGDDGTAKKPRPGTLFALYTFLGAEGFRWTRPGDAGTKVPSVAKPVPAGFSFSYSPPLLFGRLRNPKPETILAFKERLGERFSPADAERLRAENERWLLRMRLFNRGKIPHGHAFRDWQAKYLATHPEYLGLSGDGTRGVKAKNADRAKLCLSNPDVVAQIVADWRAAGRPEYWNVCPNDGSPGFCTCSGCRALDVPKPGEKPMEHLTDRYVDFWNRLAREMAKERKDVKLVTYLYQRYRLPPRRRKVERPDNMVFGLVPHLDDDVKADFAAWRRAGLKAFFVRPNHLFPSSGSTEGKGRAIYDALSFYLSNGALGADYDALTGFDGIAFEAYVVARLLSDPTLAFERLQDEFRGER